MNELTPGLDAAPREVLERSVDVGVRKSFDEDEELDGSVTVGIGVVFLDSLRVDIGDGSWRVDIGDGCVLIVVLER